MLNAEALAGILNDLFGGVMYAGIDTDKYKYPIGKCGQSTAGRSSPWVTRALSCAIVLLFPESEEGVDVSRCSLFEGHVLFFFVCVCPIWGSFLTD